jgi:hypothetical protein
MQFLLRAGIVCLLAAASAAAQDSSDPAAGSTPPDNTYTPLTTKQNYMWSLKQAIGGPPLAVVAAHVLADQAMGRPVPFGSAEDSIAERIAWHFGRSFIRQNIAFGVRALDGEDPRYFALGAGSNWTRSKYAVGHAFLRRNREGGWMPAYSRLIADFATPFIAQQWQPQGLRVGQGFRAGASGLGLAVGSNLWYEFAPDVKREFRKRFHKP